MKEINKLFQSNVFGIDTSKKAIDFAINKNGLNNMFHDTFLSFKSKKNLDIIVSGGFLYVTPDNLLRKTIKKIFSFMRKNSYLIYGIMILQQITIISGNTRDLSLIKEIC